MATITTVGLELEGACRYSCRRFRGRTHPRGRERGYEDVKHFQAYGLRTVFTSFAGSILIVLVFFFQCYRVEYELDLHPKKLEGVFTCSIIIPRFVPLLVLYIDFLTN
jgi:hypothetical protein